MGKSKEEIREHICENYYKLDTTVDKIRTQYVYDETCQGTVPEAIICFLESSSFEDALRNAVSIGGDSATITSITGAIAWQFYCRQQGFLPWRPELPENIAELKRQALAYIPEEFVKMAEDLRTTTRERMRWWGQY